MLVFAMLLYFLFPLLPTTDIFAFIFTLDHLQNDIDYIDRSFGFASAVEAAQDAIRSAKTEATCNRPNGIGIVKLMGRSAGFIAVHATLGSGDVDLCLVPEVDIVLEGPDGCFPHLRRRVKEQGYAVVVVAEGARQRSASRADVGLRLRDTGRADAIHQRVIRGNRVGVVSLGVATGAKNAPPAWPVPGRGHPFGARS